MMDRRLTQLIEWIRMTSSPAAGLLVPISGGSDSALCFWLCSQAIPDKTVGIHVGDNLRCRSWFESVGKVRSVAELAAGDDKEVMRWAQFQCISLQERLWLVGSRNRTEQAIGTYSMASRAATYLPLASVWKSEVMELCALVGVPEEITSSSRKADPDCGRPQEMSEIPLELVDIFLRAQSGELPPEQLSLLSEGQISYLDGVCKRNRFKASLPTCGPTLQATDSPSEPAGQSNATKEAVPTS